MIRKLAALLFALALSLVSYSILLAGGPPKVPAVVVVTGDTTINDFNQGSLYHTELEQRDDGAVSLQEVGLAGGWQDTTSTGLPPRVYHTSPRVGNFIYAIGGTDNVNVLGTAYVSSIQPATHQLTTWTPVTSLPAHLLGSGSAAMTIQDSTYIYVLGGFSDANYRDVATVYRATVNTANGSLSSWTTSAAWNLPLPLDRMGVVVANGYMYVLGGASNNGEYSAHAYFTHPNPDGSLPGWTETTGLPGNFSDGVVGQAAGSYTQGGVSKVYLGTGLTATHGVVPDVYSATSDPATGHLTSWVANANYQRNLVYTAGAIYGTPDCGANIFLSGGVTNQGGTLQDYVAAAPLSPPDYIAGSWYDTSALVVARQGHTMVASDDGWLYVIGGGNANGVPVSTSVIRFGETACAAAGGATRAANGTFTSRVFDLGQVTTVYSFTWNTSLSTSVPISLTYSYRWSSNPNFVTATWSIPITVSHGISLNSAVSISTTARYLQYRVTFARDESMLLSTPYLNWFKATYDGNPIPTATPRPSATPVWTPGPVPTATAGPPGGNLVTTGLEMVPYGCHRPSLDCQVQFNITVKNMGTAPLSGHLEVDAYMHLTGPPQPGTPSDTFGATDLTNLAPGAQVVVVTGPVQPTAAGSITLYAWANRNGYIHEVRTTDNILGPVASCLYAHDGQSFADVPDTAYFYRPVEYLACRGVISGYADGTFRPYANTTRSQFTKMDTLAVGWPIVTPAAGAYTFADVPPTFPFFPFVETAFSHGVISGYGCGGPGEPCDAARRPYFRPYANITRGQLAKIIALSKQWTLLTPATATFRDVAVGSTFFSFVETVYAKGVVSGYGCGTGCLEYRPGANGTRGQLSKMLYLAVTQQ